MSLHRSAVLLTRLKLTTSELKPILFYLLADECRLDALRIKKKLAKERLRQELADRHERSMAFNAAYLEQSKHGDCDIYQLRVQYNIW